MILQIKNLSKTYHGENTDKERKVLNALSFEMKAGETVSILGPSGSGKSTLLNLIAAFDKPDEGRILYKANDVQTYSSEDLRRYRNSEIGFVFQKHHLLPQCTLWENILLPTLVSEEPSEQAEARAEKLLDTLNMKKLRDQKPTELSGGECQRTAVIRALINEPSLLLADEPTGSLDELNAEMLTDLLIDMNKQFNVALIMVTHAENLAKKTDKLYRLSEGKLDL